VSTAALAVAAPPRFWFVVHLRDERERLVEVHVHTTDSRQASREAVAVAAEQHPGRTFCVADVLQEGA
jgi:hypothetical protein